MDLSEVGNYLGDDDQPAEIVRPLANFPPSLWGDRFTSFSLDNELLDTYTNEVEVLKKEVKDMIVAVGGRATEKMVLINTLERLGLSYLFEKEIEEQLEQMFTDFEDINYDLFTIALHFRIFRQHGHKIPCDVFYKFRDDNGEFKESLKTNYVSGMLTLYEATFFKTRGEVILEVALNFTKTHLESVAAQLSPPLSEQVLHALKQPLHRGMPRVEARHYISIYEREASRNDTILRLAKLDFNRVQLLHKEELLYISRWWKDLNLVSELSYARNRVVECFLWCTCVYFEPHYSLARLMLTKIVIILSLIDDTYDAYGTYEELQIFTEAVQRWDRSAIDQLPNYMKALYPALLNVYDELEKEMTKEGRVHGVYYSKAAFKEIVRSYQIEAKWLKEGYVPSFEEYLIDALVTSAGTLLATSSFIGIGEIATVEAFEWVQTNPKSVTASSAICRLVDDIMSHKEEQQRGHAASGIECYMKQYGVSKEEAIDEFYKRIEDAWMDINEEMLSPTPIPMQLLIRVLNLTRILDVTFKNGDGYTHPEALKDHVLSLFINPIPSLAS